MESDSFRFTFQLPLTAGKSFIGRKVEARGLHGSLSSLLLFGKAKVLLFMSSKDNVM